MGRERVVGRFVGAVVAAGRRVGMLVQDVVLRGPGREAGMATAEYAIATLAAAAFAGVLLVVVRSGEVRDLVTGIIRQALSI